MRLRSLLFVPGDSERKFAKACGVGADALILDLEDSVAPGNKDMARAQVAGLIGTAERDFALYVRVNALDSARTADDLAAVVKPGLDGIMLPKAEGADDVARVSAMIDRLEQRSGMSAGSVRIVVVATETPRALFGLASYTPDTPRLAGLTWGAEDLAAAIGATAKRDTAGEWTLPFQIARAHCLFAAHAAQVAAIDTLHADFRDAAGLEHACIAARRDGFTGALAIHPDQVAIINRCFTPTDDEVADARRIVDAFAANPGAGTLGIDGRMVDIPHLKGAQRVLAAAALN
jgi:citrate lyase subunit beta/citryl-CoA lyase